MEKLSDDILELLRVSKLVYEGETKYQRVKVIESHSLERCLILDDYLQSSTRDEHIYHEMLVHPASVLHGGPSCVVVIGGGEGATAREVLRWRSVEEVLMFEIDAEVVELCRKYLPELSEGVYEDARLRLRIADGREALGGLEDGSVDLIVVDVTDPTRDGASYLLYTKQFYEIARSKLREEGVLVTQSTSPTHSPRIYSSIKTTLSKVFKHVNPFHFYVPSFSALWSITIASNTAEAHSLTSSTVREALAKNSVQGLRFYSPEIHEALTKLTQVYDSYIKLTGDVITDENPVTL